MTAVAINLILFAVLLYGVFRLQGQNLSLSVRVLIVGELRRGVISSKRIHPSSTICRDITG